MGNYSNREQDLPTSVVSVIKWRAAKGDSWEQIATEYDIDLERVAKIARGASYVHVTAYPPQVVMR